MKKITPARVLQIFVAVIAFGVVVAPIAQESALNVDGAEVITPPVTPGIEKENNEPNNTDSHGLAASEGRNSDMQTSPTTPEEQELLKIDCGKAKQAVSRRWMDVIVYGSCDHVLIEDAEAWAISKLIAEVVLKNPLCIAKARGGAYKISESRYLSYAMCWF